MTRREKYPNTDTFRFYNANPKNRITDDCIFRAIAYAAEIEWEEVVRMYYETVIETKYDGDRAVDSLLSKIGWVKHKQPRKSDNTKYTGKEFCELCAYEDVRYIANIGGHHMVAIVGRQVCDIWDSTDSCIGNYWIKSKK